VSRDEEAGEGTIARVIFVHFGGCEEYVGRLASNLEKMHCNVEKFCLNGICSTASGLLFNSKPNEGPELLVFIMACADNADKSSLRTWNADFLDLLKIRPNLRRLIISPSTHVLKDAYYMYLSRESLDTFNNELEMWCAEKATHFRISYSNIWSTIKREESVAQMIFDLATDPEAKFENNVESSQTNKVCTTLLG
jgi:hypothetical protein